MNMNGWFGLVSPVSTFTIFWRSKRILLMLFGLGGIEWKKYVNRILYQGNIIKTQKGWELRRIGMNTCKIPCDEWTESYTQI